MCLKKWLVEVYIVALLDFIFVQWDILELGLVSNPKTNN